MTAVIMAIDPGLATFGIAAIVVAKDWSAEVTALDCFESRPSDKKLAVASSADRFRRARDLGEWLDARLACIKPDAIALEAMSWPRGAHAIAAIALSWGVVAHAIGRRPHVQAGPREWRDGLCARRGATEAEAHAVASMTPGYAEHAAGLRRSQLAHANDALGVALWSLRTDVVRAVVGGAR